MWKFYNGNTKNISAHVSPKRDNNNPIIQYDLNMNFIKEYPNITTAMKETSISRQTIRKSCQDGNLIFKKYYFKYINDKK